MYKEELAEISNSAQTKYNFLKNNPGGYFVSAVLAGIFVGFGVLLSYTLGSFFADTIFEKVVMGCTFCIALSLIVFAGGELFTGNNFIMIIGASQKKVSFIKCVKVWITSYAGNLLGSIILALIFAGCGLATGSLGEYMGNAALIKVSLPPLSLICRGLLCNVLVCLAVWCTYRCKEETSKLIIIFLSMLALVVIGLEHCVANMTLMTIGLMNETISFSEGIYNIMLVTVGNMIGGIFLVALPYILIGKDKSKA